MFGRSSIPPRVWLLRWRRTSLPSSRMHSHKYRHKDTINKQEIGSHQQQHPLHPPIVLIHFIVPLVRVIRIVPYRHDRLRSHRDPGDQRLRPSITQTRIRMKHQQHHRRQHCHVSMYPLQVVCLPVPPPPHRPLVVVQFGRTAIHRIRHRHRLYRPYHDSHRKIQRHINRHKCVRNDRVH